MQNPREINQLNSRFWNAVRWGDDAKPVAPVAPPTPQRENIDGWWMKCEPADAQRTINPN